MTKRILGHGVRLGFALGVSGVLVLGPVGCGGSSAPETGTQSQVSPESVKANENMKNFLDQQKAQKKKAH
jgi:hypothetical protein